MRTASHNILQSTSRFWSRICSTLKHNSLIRRRMLSHLSTINSLPGKNQLTSWNSSTWVHKTVRSISACQYSTASGTWNRSFNPNWIGHTRTEFSIMNQWLHIKLRTLIMKMGYSCLSIVKSRDYISEHKRICHPNYRISVVRRCIHRFLLCGNRSARW